MGTKNILEDIPVYSVLNSSLQILQSHEEEVENLPSIRHLGSFRYAIFFFDEPESVPLTVAIFTFPLILEGVSRGISRGSVRGQLTGGQCFV